MGSTAAGLPIVIAETGGRYVSNIEMPGGVIRYVPLQPPKNGGSEVSSAADWTIDMSLLEAAINPKTKMIVINTPYLLPPFFHFSRVGLTETKPQPCR